MKGIIFIQFLGHTALGNKYWLWVLLLDSFFNFVSFQRFNPHILINIHKKTRWLLLNVSSPESNMKSSCFYNVWPTMMGSFIVEIFQTLNVPFLALPFACPHIWVSTDHMPPSSVTLAAQVSTINLAMCAVQNTVLQAVHTNSCKTRPHSSQVTLLQTIPSSVRLQLRKYLLWVLLFVLCLPFYFIVWLFWTRYCRSWVQLAETLGLGTPLEELEEEEEEGQAADLTDLN